MVAVFVESYIIFMCHVTTSSHYRQLVSVYQFKLVRLETNYKF